MDILLNRVFTARELNHLLKYGNMNYAKKAAVHVGIEAHTLSETLRKLYIYLGKHHRNEYFYKNELLNKIVLGKHSVNTTSALRELPVGNSIADFIVINGKAQVYEIKTELDNLQRLEGQLNNYFKAFEYVNVITNSRNINAIIDNVNEDIGIFTLTSRNQIHCVRKATKHYESLRSKEMFKILRKSEFESLNKEIYGDLKQVGSSKYYAYNFKLFSNLPIERQQQYLTHFLKQRYYNKFNGKENLIKGIPVELRELVYFSKFKDSQIVKIQKLLETEG